MNKLLKQELNATIIHQEALVERLRARLCGGEHSFVVTETFHRYDHDAVDLLGTNYRKVCIKCELVVNEEI